MAGEQAATVFLRCSTTELPELALRAGIEPAPSGFRGEVSVAYATGQGGFQNTTFPNNYAGEPAKRGGHRSLCSAGPGGSGLRPRSAE